jgi:flagellar hook-associated protein 3 FlgL
MINRIASFHNYQSVQNEHRRLESKVNYNQQQLASGKQLISPGDDPIATHYVQQVKQQDEQVNQFMDAIVLVRNRLEHKEVLISSAEQYADNAKRTVMEMVNGALSPEDRQAHATQLQEMSRNLLQLVNSQDETGNYTFAGTKPKTQPFFMDANGKVSYSGDSYQRLMKISTNTEVPINVAGNKLFMEATNPYGDYRPNYSLQSGSELQLSQAKNSDPSDTASYKVTFVSMPNGDFGYQLEQNGVAVKSDYYDPKQGIEFNDLSVSVRGVIQPGDTLELSPQKTFSVFDTFQDAIALANKSVSDASATAELHRATDEFQAAFGHLAKTRTAVGTRLAGLDVHEAQHEDFKISLAKSKSRFEDLDYAKAVIDFNENQMALKASQTAFGKVKDLTLFNYI